MRSRLSFAILGVSCAGLSLAAWMLADSRQAAWLRAAGNATDLAGALSRDADRTVGAYDLALRDVRRGLLLPGMAALPPEARRALLLNQPIDPRYLAGIVVTDAAGTVVLSSMPHVPPGASLADHDCFQAQRPAGADRLFVGKPLRRPDGHDAIGFSRRLLDERGRFAGVVAAGMRQAYFQDLLRQARTDGNGAVALFDDGTLLAQDPPPPHGREFAPPDPALAARMQAQSGSQSGTQDATQDGAFDFAAGPDGTENLYGYHRVGSLPLALAVARPLRLVYAEWWQRAVVLSAVGLPLLAAALLLWRALSHELRRRGEAEREAQARGAEFRTTFDHSADGLFLLRLLPGRILLERANPALTRIWGLPAGAMEGREPRDFLAPALLAQMEPHWRACIDRGETLRIPLALDQGGRRMDLETVLTPVRDESGACAMLLGSMRDATEQGRAARRLAEAQKLEAVGRISAGVTHDFNNLLQALTIGMREAVARMPDDGNRARLRGTLHAVERGVELTRRLLSFSRQREADPRPLDPAQVVRECGELLSWILGPHIEYRSLVGAASWAVEADQAQLEMCLLNLAANARDAMPRGGRLSVRVRDASAREALQAGLPGVDSVVVAVADTGAGMDPATLARVFEAFFTTKHEARGSGLGLWMVRGFAHGHGGDVRIESEPGKGTEVAIWLPRAHAPIRPSVRSPVAPPGRPAPATADPVDPSVRHGRILLVDDDELVRRALARLLEEAGYEVTACGDGEAAERLLRSAERFDLLVADQSVPGRTGLELVAEAELRRPGMPTMMITGFARLNEAPPGTRLLHKPIDADQLLAEVALSIGQVAEPLG